MSLSWSLVNVEGHKAQCFVDGRLSPVTEALIWMTLRVDMGEITKKNWSEFYVRLRIYERVRGATLTTVTDDGETKPRYMTSEDVKKHIGLRTNVRTLRSPSKMLAKLYRLERFDFDRCLPKI